MISSGMHCGGVPEGFDIPTTGLKIKNRYETNGKAYNYICIANTSDTMIFLALCNSPDATPALCMAELNKGIPLAPGCIYEMYGTMNLPFCDIWAIHGGTGTKRICMQKGS